MNTVQNSGPSQNIIVRYADALYNTDNKNLSTTKRIALFALTALSTAIALTTSIAIIGGVNLAFIPLIGASILLVVHIANKCLKYEAKTPAFSTVDASGGGYRCVISGGSPMVDQKAYYEMVVQQAVEQKTQTLITASNAFTTDRGGDTAMLFLEPGKRISVNYNRGNYTLRCTEEKEEPINYINETGETEQQVIKVRTLTLTPRGAENPITLLHFLPTFVVCTPPAENYFNYLRLIDQVADQKGVSTRNPIVNCVTGLDRSATFAVMAGVYKYIKETQVDELKEIYDWKEFISGRAKQIEAQCCDGAATTSIENILFTNFKNASVEETEDEDECKSPEDPLKRTIRQEMQRLVGVVQSTQPLKNK